MASKQKKAGQSKKPSGIEHHPADDFPGMDLAAEHADTIRARIEEIRTEMDKLQAERTALTRELSVIWFKKELEEDANAKPKEAVAKAESKGSDAKAEREKVDA